MRRKVWIGAAVAVVLVAAGGAFMVRKTVNASQRCDTTRQQIADRGAVIEVPGDSPSVGILGDSWATGDLLPDYRSAWPFIMAGTTRSDVIIAGQGATGFSNDGYCGDGAFPHRAAALASAHPDRVIIAGGLNDVGLDLASVRSGLTATISVIDAPVVVVGPVDVPGRDGESQIDETLEQVCADLGVRYESALDWDIDIGSDGVHPTETGAQQYAARIAAILP